ncbi:hypothetical protein ACM39_13085 [Chryseobacterium sp. FH2]|uniref:DUF2947 family protein n=1 Tax=Chryseobacterium sp. FH2 TaxID=1674291 RepID=UPI00065A93D4|nr:DUF2947 family protein [Chryseobacterium sp. FH2]KMQ67372.1 hypothetical protein ACM39_13085 [Chryseobacterium sp. FH2]
MNSTIIKKTFYSEYFDDNVEDIYLLDKSESSKLWWSYIDKVANNFFKLNDNNQIIFNSKNVGDWRQYYDTDDIPGLQNFLTSILNWDKEELIFFCINKETVIKTSYEIKVLL